MYIMVLIFGNVFCSEVLQLLCHVEAHGQSMQLRLSQLNSLRTKCNRFIQHRQRTCANKLTRVRATIVAV